MKIGNLYFSFTNPSLFMLLTLSLVLLLLHFLLKREEETQYQMFGNPW
ncbi:ATP synthase subunit a [Bienertia sinuspersici]